MVSMHARSLLVCALALSGPIVAAEVAVPPDLQPWQGWVLHGEEFRRCPFLTGAGSTDAQAFQCTWPERLVLILDAQGGRFSQRWQLFTEGWISLPGDLEHWPRDVQVNGARAAVVARGGVPHIRLAAGSYAVSGGFRWSARPESLPIPAQTGVAELIIDGQRVAQPERPGNTLWLGKRRSAAEQPQMELQVYRLVTDDIPVLLMTLIRLQAAGEGREELLAPVLPPGFTPLRLDGVLPARLEPDGRLRVQVRAGSWELTLAARGAGAAESLRRPSGDGPWAREEIWSFQGLDRLRVTAVEGVEAIDPAQANVPEAWRQFPSYRMAQDSELRVAERGRGLSALDDNQLSLNRQIWFDFGHDAFTAVDSINGRMRQGWRLDMTPPYRLVNARIGDENLLVTQGEAAGTTGIELRSPALNVFAVSRIEAGSSMPATGWQSRFAQVRGTLNLPPGHRLLATLGADEAPSAWAGRWRLLDMFLVLIVSLAVARLAGWPLAAVGLLGLVLTHHDSDGMIWLWVNVLIALVLARETPEGWLRRAASFYRNVSIAALALVLIPFLANQARLAIFPQLDGAAYAAFARPPASVSEMGRAPAAAPAERLGVLEQPVDDITVTAEGKTSEAAISARGARVPGVRDAQVAQRYAPGTLVQTGPGIPDWHFVSHDYSWSGPVDAAQDLRFLIVTPFWMSVWRVLGIVLLGVLLLALVRLAFDWPRNLPAWTRFAGFPPALVLIALVTAGVPTISHAETPDAAVLNELRTRLTRAPECAPACAEVTAARVNASTQVLEIELDVSALTAVAVPVPAAPGRWEPESISIDGQANGGLYRDAEQRYWVPLHAGAHAVRLSGRIVAAETVQIVFPQPPRTLEASGEGWEFSGMSDGRLLTNSLELARKVTVGQSVRMEAATQFPPFVRVTRHARLDRDWTVATTVERLAPERGAFTVSVPLLEGESVLAEDLEVRADRTILVAMPAGQATVQWFSGLPRAEVLTLKSMADPTRVEVWRLNVSPQWSAHFEGTPAVLPLDLQSPEWTYEYHPRAAEQLAVRIARPQPAEGATLAFDAVDFVSDVGRRSANTSLALRYRSTQGGRHVMRLPEDARVTGLTVDGQSVPLRPQNGELALALLPGSHTLDIDWQSDGDIGVRSRAPTVDLGISASNIQTTLSLPADRWSLYAFGPGIAPAILFWSELVVFIVAAVLLGRSRRSPLRTQEWLLLGLGLSTFSWGVLFLFAAWMFVMRWRSGWEANVSRRAFNWLQVGLGLLSVVALISLVAAIPFGLLASPDMRVQGIGTGANVFSWFLDQTAGVLPRPGVISVSLWWYKLAMLAWALWLSFALLRWVPWAWRAFNANGLWRGEVVAAAAPPSTAASTDYAVNPG